MSDIHQDLPARLSQSPSETPNSSIPPAKPPRTPYNRTSSVATPFASFAPLTAANTPVKPHLPVEVLKERFGDFGTPTPAGIATRCEAYDDIVASIIELSPEEWLPEGQAAVFKEQLRTRKGARILQEKLVHAFEAASRAQSSYTEILRRCHSLDPGTHAFCIFKTLTLAKTLCYHPELATQLKIEVSNMGFNAGYPKVCEWIEIVAENPEGMLEDIAIRCDQVEVYDLGDGVDLRENLVAMAHHFENDYDELCKIYPEYETVPKVVSDE